MQPCKPLERTELPELGEEKKLKIMSIPYPETDSRPTSWDCTFTFKKSTVLFFRRKSHRFRGINKKRRLGLETTKRSCKTQI
jgi:hypothetical protein